MKVWRLPSLPELDLELLPAGAVEHDLARRRRQSSAHGVVEREAVARRERREDARRAAPRVLRSTVATAPAARLFRTSGTIRSGSK